MKKNDEVKVKFIPKTNEKYISSSYGRKRFFDSCIFVSSSLDKLVKTLVDNSHYSLKDLGEELVDKDEILNIVIQKKIFKEDRNNNDSIKYLNKLYPDKIEKIKRNFT